MKFLSVFIICLHLSSAANAQFTYQLATDVPVNGGGASLKFPWVGGLNSAQYSTMDLNGDTQSDLVVFDRSGNRVYTFLNQGGKYIYSPDYAFHFPEAISSWMLLRDFNCDGKKDIFTSHPFGIRVFINNTISGEKLTWQPYVSGTDYSGNDQHFLKTIGFTSVINMQMNASDIPAIVDIDGDTDLDILFYRPSGASTIEFHKNLSIEKAENCELLEYERITQTWGDFQECECGTFVFNGKTCDTPHGREQHQGGKALLLIDMDEDGDQDVVVSEESCPYLFYLENEGDVTQVLLKSATPDFPPENPVFMPYFPVAYYEDVNFDGVQDLIVSPNVSHHGADAVNFQSSGWFYKNAGTVKKPRFNLVQRNFLQDQMIDLGENATPAFIDHDQDGDLDLLVGNQVNYDVSSVGFSTLRLYENVGSSADPSFQLVDNDFLGLSSSKFFNIKPRVRDVNGDAYKDLVFSATKSDNNETNIYYMPQKGDGGFMNNINKLFSDVTADDSFELTDISGDGLPDLLLGKGSGAIAYYKNTGMKNAPAFVLDDETFYDFDRSSSRINITTAVADLNADGRQEMIVGDGSGGLTVFEGFMHHLDKPEMGVKGLLVSSSGEDTTPEAFNFGSKIWPVIADLFNEDKPAIILGTGQGGLHILRNIEAHEDDSQLAGAIDLFPNPISKSTNNRLRILSDVGGAASIRSVLGQRVTFDFALEANTPYELSVAQFKPGLYMLILAANEGRLVTQKFIVVD